MQFSHDGHWHYGVYPQALPFGAFPPGGDPLAALIHIGELAQFAPSDVLYVFFSVAS